MLTIDLPDVMEAVAKAASKLGRGVFTSDPVKGRTDAYVVGFITDEIGGMDAIFLVWKDWHGNIQVKRLIAFQGASLTGPPKAEQQENLICIRFEPAIGTILYPLDDMGVKGLVS